MLEIPKDGGEGSLLSNAKENKEKKVVKEVSKQETKGD